MADKDQQFDELPLIEILGEPLPRPFAYARAGTQFLGSLQHGAIVILAGMPICTRGSLV